MFYSVISMKSFGVKSVALIPLRRGKELYGFVDILDFDVQKAGVVRELGGLISIYLGTEISNHLLMDKLEEYKALRTAATALKDGIAQRTKFYIPDSIQANMTWPETGNRWLDLGMLFNNENYTLAKFIVMESDRNVPRIRILKEKNGVVAPVKQISFAKEGIRDTQLFTLDYLDSEAVELVLDILEDSKNTLSEDAVFGLEINLSPINETIGGMEFEDHTYFLKFPETFALLLYNFYHDGQYTARIKNVMETRGWFHP